MKLLRAALFGAALTLALPAAAGTIHREDGIHTEAWFQNQSFMDLKEEAGEAAKAGKGFVLVWEQPGCGSCQKLHEVNFQDPKLIDYIGRGFTVMSMNMYGEVEVTDFDGEKLAEKELAFKHKVQFTPTTIFFDAKGQELFRMPGYLSPFFYLAGFVYVAEKGYADPEFRGMFPRWSKTKGERVREIYGAGPS